MIEPKIYGHVCNTVPKCARLVPVITLTDHSKLTNLDYEHSGHTGFAGILYDTTSGWESKPEYIPPEGMLIVYKDYAQSEGVDVPGLKIGNGINTVGDLPFISGGAAPQPSPSVVSFSLANLPESVRVGQTVTLSSITHQEVNIDYIAGGTLSLYVNNTLLGTCAASDVVVTIPAEASYVVQASDQALSFTLKGFGTDGQEFSSEPIIVPVSTAMFFLSGDNTFNGMIEGQFDAQAAVDLLPEVVFEENKNYRYRPQVNSYIWFVYERPIYITDNIGFDYTEEYYKGEYTVQIDGAPCTVYVYRSDLLAPGSYTYLFSLD